MIFMDDICEHLDMVRLGIASHNHANYKSKVIFTTRSKEVCDQMLPDQQIKVNCLEGNDALILFKQNVGVKALNSHPRIPGLAEQVARECEGLPLALIIIGRAMASKQTPRIQESKCCQKNSGPCRTWTIWILMAYTL